MYGGEAKVPKTLLSNFMEAANVLMIDGLSDKDKVEKVKENPVLKENKANVETDILDESEPSETTSEEDYFLKIDPMFCDSCDFKTTAKSKHNQTSVIKRHKKVAHEDEDGITEVAVDNGEEILEEKLILMPDEGGLSCTICGFVTTAKSKGNQTSVMGRHNRKVHGNYEYADIHLSGNLEQDLKEGNIITLEEDLHQEEEPSPASNPEEPCQICGFKSVAKSKGNRSMVLKRHMVTAHESK